MGPHHQYTMIQSKNLVHDQHVIYTSLLKKEYLHELDTICFALNLMNDLMSQRIHRHLIPSMCAFSFWHLQGRNTYYQEITNLPFCFDSANPYQDSESKAMLVFDPLLLISVHLFPKFPNSHQLAGINPIPVMSQLVSVYRAMIEIFLTNIYTHSL